MTDHDFDPPLTDAELGYLVDEEDTQWCDDCGIEIHHRGRCRYCYEAAHADWQRDQDKDERNAR